MRYLIGLAGFLILLGAGLFFIALKGLENYPTTFIVTSLRIDNNNQYFLDNEQMNGKDGFCFTIRNKEKSEIKLTNRLREEKIFIYNKPKLKISESYGHDLGLQIINVNGEPDLREKFNCKI